MRTPQAIIQELKHQLNWSQPNIRFTEMSNLINGFNILNLINLYFYTFVIYDEIYFSI